jgi:tRNA G18 (ribose-2'-O)-methylase SpoU
VLVRIPISTAADSLNVSTAAAIALYECRRARPPPTIDGQEVDDGVET